MSNPLKKTMVFLGLAEEGLEEETVHEAPAERNAAPAATATAKPNAAPVQRAAAVTPLRRVTPVRSQVPQSMNEILMVNPTGYKDAKMIAENYREGLPVIMNLSNMDADAAKRLVDFCSGLTLGLNGRIEKVTNKVFLLSPEHVVVGSDQPVSEADGSFFVAPSA